MTEKKLEFVHTKLVRDSWMRPDTYINSPDDAVEVIRNILDGADKEVCAVINISTSGQVINASFFSVGTINQALVSPPDVFRSAILSGAASIIMLHNHPSGNLVPSKEDCEVTRRLALAGQIVGVGLLDSVIVSDFGKYSFRESAPQYLDPKSEGVVAPDLMAADVEEKGSYMSVSDFRKKTVEDILQKIRNGDTFSAPLWNSFATSPRNPISGAVYHGGNRLILMNQAINRKYKDPRWMTFLQLSQNGYRIKKGEHGVRLEKWIFSKWEKVKNPDGGIDKKEVMLEKPMVKFFTVFNGEQVEDFPPIKDESIYKTFEGSGKEAVIDAMLLSSACPVHETAGDKSFYSPKKDEIILPMRSSFQSIEAFGHAAAHEMIHSTGHQDRLHRTFGKRDALGVPDTRYCIEELRAELGSLFLTSDLGIGYGELEEKSTAAYVGYYLDRISDALLKDPNVLFHAAADAEKAEQFLIRNMEKKKLLSKETLLLPKNEPAEEISDPVKNPDKGQYEKEVAAFKKL